MKHLNLDYSKKLLNKIEMLSKADWGSAQEIATIANYDVDDIVDEIQNNSYKFCMSEMSNLLHELKQGFLRDVLTLDLSLHIDSLNEFKKIIKQAEETIDKCTIDFAE